MTESTRIYVREVLELHAAIIMENRKNRLSFARCLIPIQQLPTGALPYYLKDSEEKAQTPSTQRHYHDGMNCKKCNTLNKYVTEPNQSDGTYLCWSCRTGF